MYKKLLIATALMAGSLTLQADEIKDLNAKLDALTEEIAKVKDARSFSHNFNQNQSIISSQTQKTRVILTRTIDFSHN